MEVKSRLMHTPFHKRFFFYEYIGFNRLFVRVYIQYIRNTNKKKHILCNIQGYPKIIPKEVASILKKKKT